MHFQYLEHLDRKKETNELKMMTTTLDTQELFSQKIYWLNQLSGELPETNLIQDYARPSQYTGKIEVIILSYPIIYLRELLS